MGSDPNERSNRTAPFDPRNTGNDSLIAGLLAGGEKIGNTKDPAVQEQVDTETRMQARALTWSNVEWLSKDDDLGPIYDFTPTGPDDFVDAFKYLYNAQPSELENGHIAQEYHAQVERVRDKYELDNLVVDTIMALADKGVTSYDTVWKALDFKHGVQVPPNILVNAILELADIAERYSDVRGALASRSSDERVQETTERAPLAEELQRRRQRQADIRRRNV